ncbi:DUF6064 family protein [Massilia sp. ST3]|uniref:DUF6064 family protein n=1 Tax=Massilia sp. ST3 TaxID=2824903 RepID=UPI001B836014|nr:DUF6064 family protein [Massilia sp. ST3]MBQ5949345.1 hypothetical protein [Massilia sp. ST3]
MSEWWTYTLSDLLMFSARSYHRLFELYNQDIWPAQIVALLAGLAMLAGAVGGGARPSRIAALLLGLAWLWVAWAFHLERYAAINTAAPWFAAGFVLQGLMLLWMAAKPMPRLLRFNASPISWLGLGLVCLAVGAYPLLPIHEGRYQTQGEVFGVAPDPTAVATLGILLLMRARWPMWVVPVAWCAISGAIQMELRVPLAWLPVTAAALATGAWLVRRSVLSSTVDSRT